MMSRTLICFDFRRVSRTYYVKVHLSWLCSANLVAVLLITSRTLFLLDGDFAELRRLMIRSRTFRF